MRISEGQARTLAEAKELNLALPLNDGSKLNATELDNSSNTGGASYLGELANYPNEINKGELAIVDNNLIIGSGNSKDIISIVEYPAYKDLNGNRINKKIPIEFIDVYTNTGDIINCSIIYKNIEDNEFSVINNINIINDCALRIPCEINNYPAILTLYNKNETRYLIAVSSYFSNILNIDVSFNVLLISFINSETSHIITIPENGIDAINNSNSPINQYSKFLQDLNNKGGSIVYSRSEINLNEIIHIKHTNIYDKIDTSKFIKNNQFSFISEQYGIYNPLILKLNADTTIAYNGDNDIITTDISFLTNPLNWEIGNFLAEVVKLNNIKITYYDDWTTIQIPDLTEIENDDNADVQIDIDGLESENDEFKLGPAIVLEYDVIVEGNRYFMYQIYFAYKYNPINNNNNIGAFATTANHINSPRDMLCIDNGLIKCTDPDYADSPLILLISQNKNISLVTSENFNEFVEQNKTIQENNIFSEIFCINNGSSPNIVDSSNGKTIFAEQNNKFDYYTNDQMLHMYKLYNTSDYNLGNALYFNNKIYINLIKALNYEVRTISDNENNTYINAYYRELDKLKINISDYLLNIETLNYTYRFLLLDLNNYSPNLDAIPNDTILFNIIYNISIINSFNTNHTEDNYNKLTTLVLPYIEYNIDDNDIVSRNDNSILTLYHSDNMTSLITKSDFGEYIYGVDIFTKLINNN